MLIPREETIISTELYSIHHESQLIESWKQGVGQDPEQQVRKDNLKIKILPEVPKPTSVQSENI